MGELDNRLLEVTLVFWSIKVYNMLLDFIVGFLVFALVFELIGVRLLYTLVPAFTYMLLRIVREYMDRDILGRLRDKYDNLDQRLGTAVENRGVRNIIVDDLLADVAKRMQSVESSTFLNSKALRNRVFTIVLLSFMLLTTTVLNLHNVAIDSINYLLDSSNMKDKAREAMDGAVGGFDTLTGNRWEKSNYSDDKSKDKLGAQAGGNRPGMSSGPIPGKGSGTGTDPSADIYGKASSASIAGNDVDFRLRPEYGGDIEIRETGARAKDPAFQMQDVQSAEQCVECVVGPEHEEVVRKYFEKILPET